MDKIKDMIHGGHKKEGDNVHDPAMTTTTTAGGYGQPGVAHPTGEQGHEKKGLFGMGGHKKVSIISPLPVLLSISCFDQSLFIDQSSHCRLVYRSEPLQTRQLISFPTRPLHFSFINQFSIRAFAG